MSESPNYQAAKMLVEAYLAQTNKQLELVDELLSRAQTDSPNRALLTETARKILNNLTVGREDTKKAVMLMEEDSDE